MSFESAKRAVDELFIMTKDLVLGNESLRRENNRLKEGDFTPEEFQNLCHNLHKFPGCTLPIFDEGCKMYQELLFGKEVCEQYRKQH